MTCNRCLQEIIEGESFWEDEAEGTAYHNDCRRAAIDRRNKAEDERVAALARAEAIEAERDDLRDANGVLSEALEAARQMLVKLSARVAELEAQLAAQGWRPVTEEPARPGLYQTGEFLENGTLYDVGHTFWEEGGWVDECYHELLPNMTHYRPIGRPLPPAPAPQEPTP